MGICVFSTMNGMDAGMVKNALDENNIENFIQDNSLPFLGVNSVTGNINITVREEDAEKAFEIVETLFADS